MRSDRPLVSCIMPTRDRQDFVYASLALFAAQSWPEIELVILDDKIRPSFLIPPSMPRVHYHQGDDLTIGAKRNVLAQLAHGSIIAHWDDDDWYAPHRIADQVERILSSGRAVTGYCPVHFTNGTDWWLYRASSAYVGASLMYRRDFWETCRFKDVNEGEDTAFVRRAGRARQIEVASGVGNMFARIHPRNTSEKKTTNKQQWIPVAAPRVA